MRKATARQKRDFEKLCKGLRKVTVATVNAELKRRGIAERLVKGRGYFYFADGTASQWPAQSVMVFRADQLSLEQWMCEHTELRDRFLQAEWTSSRQHDAHVETYDREMQDRSDQHWVSNGGSYVAECGTLIEGPEM